MGNEENSFKIAKENEELKQKLLDLNKEKHKSTSNLTNAHNIYNNKSTCSKQNGHNTSSSSNLKTIKLQKNESTNKNENNPNNTNNNDHYDDLNPNFKISEINSHRVSVEYLKNVLLKYLEAIAIGNEFQIKILENVIFSILRIPNSERQKLEDKRNRSSFYFNLWHNAKAYLAAKIYGNANEAQSFENPSHSDSFNFEMDKSFIDAIKGVSDCVNEDNSDLNGVVVANNFVSNFDNSSSAVININSNSGNSSNSFNKLNIADTDKNFEKDLTGEDLDVII